jgi:hypothetical protein
MEKRKSQICRLTWLTEKKQVIKTQKRFCSAFAVPEQPVGNGLLPHGSFVDSA